MVDSSTHHGIEYRVAEDGTLDEVVGYAFVHVEQMDDGHYWMGLSNKEGEPFFWHSLDFVAKGNGRQRRIDLTAECTDDSGVCGQFGFEKKL